MRRMKTRTANPLMSRAIRRVSRPKLPGIAVPMMTVLLLATSCVAAAPRQETRDDTFTVGSSPRLVVNSDNGRIDVVAGPPGVIVVQAMLTSPSRLDYDVTRDGDTILVEARQQDGFRSISPINSPRADITITAPGTAFFDLRTGGGDVWVEGMRASGNLRTSSGRLALNNVKGEFNGGTSNGPINVNFIEGMAALETSNGAVRVERGRGEFELQTSNGGIFFQGELTPGGKNGFLTSNGSVTVKLEGEPSLRVLATTSNGSVTSRFPIASNSGSGENFSGIIGDGKADLIIRASNGSVVLE